MGEYYRDRIRLPSMDAHHTGIRTSHALIAIDRLQLAPQDPLDAHRVRDRRACPLFRLGRRRGPNGSADRHGCGPVVTDHVVYCRLADRVTSANSLMVIMFEPGAALSPVAASS